MKATRTEQIYIRDNETISMVCHLSKNLFNQANYILRQQFMKGETMTGYSDLVKQFQIPDENNENNNYQKLPAQTAQWTIKKVKQSWYSFFKARRAWKKHPEKFTGMPKPPKYNIFFSYVKDTTQMRSKVHNAIQIVGHYFSLGRLTFVSLVYTQFVGDVYD